MRKVAIAGVLIATTTVCGCASDPAGPPTPGNKEVRGNADRSFDRMKQEEREHGKGAH